jgi:uncharacterized protein YjbI with pentapeptide repeats
VLGPFPNGAVVRRRSFDGRDLTTARARQLWFDRCSFIGADLRHATLDGCWFKMCDFRTADLRGASLRGTRFAGCDLRDVDLRNADLTGGRLDFVNTGAAPHSRTNVTGANFAGARPRDIQADQVIGWPE